MGRLYFQATRVGDVMNREETAEAIKVMQEFMGGADGLQIKSSRARSDYRDTIMPSWNWNDDADMYRFKPKPRE